MNDAAVIRATIRPGLARTATDLYCSSLMKTRRFLAPVFALLVSASFAPAHELWIEDTPTGELVIRFAEYGGDYEKSPGALDSIILPFAWAPSVEAPEPALAADGKSESRLSKEARAIKEGKVEAFDVQKKTDHYLLVGARPEQAAQVETGFTVMGNGGDASKPARKPYFYARWQPANAGPAKPGLNFDIVPTGTAGEACVYFRGKPLEGVKVKLYPPAEAEQELTSDKDGKIHFSVAKPGLYLLAAARQRETVNGFFGGKAYDVASHNCSLAWRQP